MAIFYDEIPHKHLEWIAKQKMFWVASAALGGHVNISPKGCIDTFHILDKNRVWYEDMTGSGVETIAHIREPGNGRVTIMFHAFEGAPRILRLWGTGTVHELGTPEYDALIPPENRKPGSRAAIVIDVHKVATSCGYGVPQYQFIGQRSQLERFGDNLELVEKKAPPTEKAPNGIKAWWAAENTRSFDGLPALEQAHNTTLVLRNSYDRNASRVRSQTGPTTTATQPSVKLLDGRVLMAFSLGVATTLAVLRLCSSRVH